VSTVRAVVGDRSIAVRAVLRKVLEETGEISVIGEADDGREIVDLTARHHPDVVVLDLDLPSLAGRELVDALCARRRVPLFVITPKQHRDRVREAIGAHGVGVVAVYPKPEHPDEWTELGKTLREAVAPLAGDAADGGDPLDEPDDTPVVGRNLGYVAIGGSAGGPGAIFELLRALGPTPKVGVAVVQHIAAGFEEIFAEWLSAELEMDVAVARDGEGLCAGRVRLAPTGSHLILDPGGTLRLDGIGDPVNGHRPAVDRLFRSLLEHRAERVAAVLLSGMGSDGAEAMAELRRVNVLTIAQSRRSCAIFGMPRAAIERRGVVFTLAPEKIGRFLAGAGRDVL
jgi:two-component system chemotaxis response regulator CheB